MAETETNKALSELARCLRLLDANDYFNGGQTVVARFPHGSERRAQIIAEAEFWRAMATRPPTTGPHECGACGALPYTPHESWCVAVVDA